MYISWRFNYLTTERTSSQRISRVQAVAMDSSSNTSVLYGQDYSLPDDFFVHRALEKLAGDAAVGQRTAVYFQDASVTFHELNRRADRLAARLSRAVAAAGERERNADGDRVVAVCHEPSVDLIVSLLSIFKIGAAYLPLEPSFPADRVRHILDDAQPVMLLTSKTVLADSAVAVALTHVVPKGNGTRVLCIDDETEEEEEEEEEEEDASAGDQYLPIWPESELASVLYTSGSTGVPKGVRLGHKNIQHRIDWQWRRFPYGGPEEMCCFKTALTFVDSIAEMWAPLLAGRPIRILPKAVTQNTEKLVDQLDRFRVTRLVLVPSLLRAVINWVRFLQRTKQQQQSHQLPPPQILKRLSVWVCSGELLTAELLVQFYDCFDSGTTTICNFYGSTEVTGDVTFITFNSRQDVLQSLVDNKVPIG